MSRRYKYLFTEEWYEGGRIATSIPAEEIFRGQSFDLVMKRVAFSGDTCSLRFSIPSDTDDLLTHFRRQEHPYIYDMLLQLSVKGLFPLTATIIYNEDRNIYYFYTEV